MLILIEDVLLHPKTNWNADCVQTVRDHGLDVVLGDPPVPVALPRVAGFVHIPTISLLHALALSLRAVALHIVVPLTAGHPWLDNVL